MCQTIASTWVAETIGATPVVHETIQFHDIAGLVRGAHEGEGLGNKFLGNIRETDAILHVVRAHDDAQVVHPEGRVDPLADVETIETELVLADLDTVERALRASGEEGAPGGQDAQAEVGRLRKVVAALQAGGPRARRPGPTPSADPDAPGRVSADHLKPVLYVANLGEGDGARVPARAGQHAAERGARSTCGERPARPRAGGSRPRRGGRDADRAGRGAVGPRP